MCYQICDSERNLLMCHIMINKAIWLLTGVLSFIAAVTGVCNPVIYKGLVSSDFMPGVLSQDLMTIAASVSLIALVLLMKKEDIVKQILIIGILGYILYAYGIYSIEQFYNELYLLYLSIFGLSFYSIVLGIAFIQEDAHQKVRIGKGVKNISAGISLMIPMLFYPLWISQLIPLMIEGNKIESAYSVYILDMAFVLPLFVVIPVMALKGRELGLILMPVLFIKGFTLLFSVALGVFLKPYFHQETNLAEFFLYFLISILFFAIAILYFKSMKVQSSS